MNVLFVNTSEKTGGAAIAAGRIAAALRKQRVNVSHCFRRGKAGFYIERAAIWATNGFSRENLFAVDIANYGEDITELPEFKEADIIHLHWINQGFLSISGLKKIFDSGKPVVWTMHDMWPCTGICHHSRDCDNYFNGCHNCQYLRFPGSRDLSSRVYQKKTNIYSESNITFIACSNWLRERASHSRLLKGHPLINIPNPIDTDFFKPEHKENVGQTYRILFGSAKVSDKRKGIDYFIKACNILKEKHPELSIKVVCYGQNSEVLSSLVPYPVESKGYVSGDAAIRDLYNSVDLFVTPSLEDNLPNTIMEAMACGVPCVGFDVGGIPEMIEHKETGYVAEYKSAEDFADGIVWTLDKTRYEQLSKASRQKVIANYSEDKVAEQYIRLYQSLFN